MKVTKQFAAILIAIVTLSLNFVIIAAVATIIPSVNNIILQNGQDTFTVDLNINNNGNAYCGAEFGLNLGNVTIESIHYSVSQSYTSAGPTVTKGITYFGFFNANNIYADGDVCSVTFKYTGTSDAKLVIAETTVSTRKSANNVTDDTKQPNTEITVTRASASSTSSNTVSSDTSNAGSSSTSISGTIDQNPSGTSNDSIPCPSSTNSNNTSSENNKLTTVFQPTDKIPTNDVLQVIESTNNDILVNLTQADMVSKDIFTAIKGQDKNITFNIEDSAGKTVVSWTFNGKDITGEMKDVELVATYTDPVKTQQEIKKLIGNDQYLAINFANNGVLPGTAQIKLFIGNNFSTNNVLNLYYYNDQTGKVDLVGSQLTVDKDGYVSFNIAHCSTYFTTKTTIKDVVQNIPTLNSQTNNIEQSYLLIAVRILSVAVVVLVCVVILQFMLLIKVKKH